MAAAWLVQAGPRLVHRATIFIARAPLVGILVAAMLLPPYPDVKDQG